MKHKTTFAVFFVLLVTNQIWAEGMAEGANKLHPGAKMILEANGYIFDSNNKLVSYNNRSIIGFPDEYKTNTNPYAYEKNTIYLTNFDVTQWLGKNAVSTTGSERTRQSIRTFMSTDFNKIMNMGGMENGTRIFIQNVPDKFLSQMSGNIQNAFLVYVGTQSFQMANGSSQVFPVFELIDIFNATFSQAIRTFNSAFDAGVYKEDDGYEYSNINGRIFGRDKATKKELHEWNGNQWLLLIGGEDHSQ
jgi:hypothetical protein